MIEIIPTPLYHLPPQECYLSWRGMNFGKERVEVVELPGNTYERIRSSGRERGEIPLEWLSLHSTVKNTLDGKTIDLSQFDQFGEIAIRANLLVTAGHDNLEAYRLAALCYLSKLVTADELESVARAMDDFCGFDKSCPDSTLNAHTNYIGQM